MKKFSKLHDQGRELESRLRLQTFPLAIKLLKNEDDIPKNKVNDHVTGQTLWAISGRDGGKFSGKTIRPKKDFGYHISLCQGFAMSRREGITIAMFKEDMWCFEPIVGYGWTEPPQYFLDGHNRYPQDVSRLSSGKNYAKDFPRLDTGIYKGVISAPLTTAQFNPDLIILYCNSMQLSLLLLAREWKDGHDLQCHLSSHAACVYSVVTAIQSGNYQVAVPCRGDHYFAMASDWEMIFSFPLSKFDELMEGFRYLEKSNFRMPRNPQMRIEPTFAPSYSKILGMLGCGRKNSE